MTRIEVIYGPPGTGKTATVVERVKQYKDKNFLFCSFTKAAAKEGLGRIGKVGRARTIHSIAFELAGINRSQVVDNPKLKEFSDVIGIPMNCYGIENGEILLGDELMALVNLARCKMVPVINIYKEVRPDFSFSILEMFDKSYTNYKNKWGYVDFNDILEKSLDKPSIKLDALFVDEAQDLSPLQWEVVKKIETDYICIAGDDDQSIYSWSGADPHGMDRFHNHGTVLSQSHRVPRQVYQISEKIISKVKDRKHKSYAPTKEEGEINYFGDMNGIKPRNLDTLVLYRNHSVRWMAEEWLVNNKIPYTCTGPKGMFDNRFAMAVKKYIKAQNESPEQLERDMLSLKKYMNRSIATLPFDEYRKIPWYQAIWVPADQEGYLRGIDLDAKPKYRLSTIHSAKGMEAEQVILLTAMGHRTWESMSDAEHRVWYVGVTRTKKILNIVQGGLDYVI
ncbi:ATP-dependent helicase [Candidatus Pacearchaeota archaeon]|nr:ATP-dependent helicase [Candidatus Pacearchaeota archaeon]